MLWGGEEKGSGNVHDKDLQHCKRMMLSCGPAGAQSHAVL